MIHILSWTSKIIKKHFPGHYIQSTRKFKKFQGLTWKFKDFSRKNGIQGLPLKFKDFSRLCKPWNCNITEDWDVTKISCCQVNTTNRRAKKQLGISFGSIFPLFFYKSSLGTRS